jgi:hypothetical protein
VAACTIMFSWFKNKEVAFAMGFSLSFSNLGSVINDLIEPELAEETGSVVLGLWVGTAICVASLVCGLILI